MAANKHISKIILAVMALAVVLCFLAGAFSDELAELLGGTSVKMEYESKLFDTTRIIEIDIRMDGDDWDAMLSNAMSEEYYVCDVSVNGKTFKSVAIRPKGNTSLSAIAMDSDNDRYSLKLEFDHFVKGQTCWGLDKLILNNNYADATNMKEAVIYDMFQYLGADASLYNYAKISVNGEYFGVYLALEGVEESFMLRNFGTQDGELYKPDSMDMGGGGGSSSGGPAPKMDFSGVDLSGIDFSQFEGKTPPSGGFPGSGSGSDGAGSENGAQNSEDAENGSSGNAGFDPNNMPDMGSFDPNNMPDMGSFDPNNMPDMGSFNPGSMPGGESAADGGTDSESSDSSSDKSRSSSGASRRGGFSMGGGGANLNYTDDDLDSYSTIWEGEVTGTSTGDHRRVVTALKNISEGTDLETYLDVDNILKYMAVHAFSVNMDSLSGSMAHNYYLYEYEGRLNLFPWDYNLSLGGMSMGGGSDGTSLVNDAIDTPFSGTQFFDALLENETYLEQYHAYLRQLVEEYVNGGRFDEVYNRIRSQIDSLVETDPSANYEYEDYEKAVGILYEVVKLRAESIEGQLDGAIPSTDAGQRENSSSLIDASHIDVKAMGQFNMGGSGENFVGRPGRSRPGSSSSGAAQSSVPETTQNEEAPTTTEAPAVSEAPSTQTPTTEEAQQAPGGSGQGNMPDMGSFDPNNMPDMGSFDPNNLPDMGSFDPNNLPDMGSFDPNNMPDMGGMTPPGASGGSKQAEQPTTQQEESAAPEESAPDAVGENASPSETNADRPSIPGMPGSSAGSAKIKNLIVFPVCFAAILIVLLLCKIFVRRK